MDASLHNRLIVCVLAVALALAMAVMLPRATSAAPPVPVDRPGEVIDDECDFPVLLEVSGKEKVIETGNGNTIITSPGLRATLTNLDEPTNQVTLNITGTVRVQEQANGDVVYVFRGRNLLYGPDVDLILTIGRFTGTETAEGEFSPLTGNGRIIDVCALLE